MIKYVIVIYIIPETILILRSLECYFPVQKALKFWALKQAYHQVNCTNLLSRQTFNYSLCSKVEYGSSKLYEKN